MKITIHPRFAEVDVSGSADDYASLAALVSEGGGSLVTDSAAEASGRLTLSRVCISTAPGEPVRIHADTVERSLLISGDLRYLAVLAANLASMARDQRGGHQHVEYFPGHAYLAEGSAPVILTSPHGGMPGDATIG